MKKRMISFAIILAMVMTFCPVFAAYATDSLPSYDAYYDFASDVFSYGTRNVGNGEMGTMVTNADGSMYINGGNYITAAWISTGEDPAVCSVLTFTAPYAGTITINPNTIINRGQNWDCTNYAASYADIYHNSFANGIASYSIPANDTPVAPEALENIEVAAGDQIMFMVGSISPLNSFIEWMPTVVYTEATHIHSWAAGWNSDETAHWHECTVSGCDIENNAEKEGYAEHTDVNFDFACDVCDAACTLSYSAYDDFSTDVFSYRTRNVANGEMGAMVTNADGSMYIGGGNYITAAWISTGVDPAVCSVVTFKVPYAGTITINPNSIINRGQYWDCTNYAASYAQIYHNSFANGIANYSIPANGTPAAPEALANIKVAAGDQIMFMVGSNSPLNSYIEWMPTVVYTEVAHVHSWAEGWTSDGTHHWHECAASGCDIENNAEKDGYAEHADVNLDFVCDTCGAACAISYSAYDDFSTDVFSYGTRNVGNGEMGTMVTNADGSMYINGGNYITAAWISTGVDPAVCSVLTFTAPYTGTITINSNSIINRGQYWDCTNYAASYAQIYHNSFANGIAAYNLPANGTPVVAEALANIEVVAGDQIMFMVGSNATLNSYIEWIPEITYSEILPEYAEIDQYNVSLADDLNLNFYLNVSEYYTRVAEITVTAFGTETTYDAATLPKNADGKYVLSVALAAAQMTEMVSVRIVVDGAELVNESYSVLQYAQYILDDANGFTAKDKMMVQAMLHYGAAAQEYFDINTDKLADAGYTDTVAEQLPDASGYNAAVSGSVDGITLYGASLLFKDKIAVRFYFTVNGTDTYTVNGKTLTQKGDLWYVDFEDIAPQDLSNMIEVIVSNGEGDSFTVSYSPVHYIVRQYNKTENAELKKLVQNLYDYHKAALAYVA